MVAKLTAYSRPVVILTALALLVDLVLTWRNAPVQTQYLSSDGGASALQGWGMLAAALLVVFLVAEMAIPRMRKVLLAIAVAASAATVLEFFTGTASVVNVDGTAVPATEETLWPAYLGLVLAVVLVVAAVRRLLEPEKQPLPMTPFRTAWKPKPDAS